MFHLDGGRLLMTHYCGAGNQPRMQATASPDGKTITFNFVDATDLATPETGHMHRLVLTLVDANHHTEAWSFLANGKEVTERFDSVSPAAGKLNPRSATWPLQKSHPTWTRSSPRWRSPRRPSASSRP